MKKKKIRILTFLIFILLITPFLIIYFCNKNNNQDDSKNELKGEIKTEIDTEISSNNIIDKNNKEKLSIILETDDEHPFLTSVDYSLLEKERDNDPEMFFEFDLLLKYLDNFYENEIENKIIIDPQYPNDYKFTYLKKSYKEIWDKEALDNIGFYIRLTFDNNPNYYLDAGYNKINNTWTFTLRNMEEKPYRNNRYVYEKYQITDDTFKDEKSAPVTDITVEEVTN